MHPHVIPNLYDFLSSAEDILKNDGNLTVAVSIDFHSIFFVKLWKSMGIEPIWLQKELNVTEIIGSRTSFRFPMLTNTHTHTHTHTHTNAHTHMFVFVKSGDIP